MPACLRVGVDNVIASDVRTSRKLLEGGPFYYCDVQVGGWGVGVAGWVGGWWVGGG